MLIPSSDPSPLVQTDHLYGRHARRVRATGPARRVATGLESHPERLVEAVPGLASCIARRGVARPFSRVMIAFMTSAPDGVALQIRNLRKAYGDVVAVDGLDLEIRRGECFGLLGPNGAGKTTTIEICEGLNTPDAGDVTCSGTAGARMTASFASCWAFPAGNPVLRKAHRRRDDPPVPQLLSHGPSPAEVIAMVQLQEKSRGARGTVLRRSETAAGAGLRPGGRSRPAVPGRADHRTRSAVAPAALGADRRLQVGWTLDSADDPLYGRGRAALRSRRDRGSRPHHRPGYAR